MYQKCLVSPDNQFHELHIDPNAILKHSLK